MNLSPSFFLLLLHTHLCTSFITTPSQTQFGNPFLGKKRLCTKELTQLSAAQKQTRSSLLNPPTAPSSTKANGNSNNVRQSQPAASAGESGDDETKEEIYGAKFFGGNAIKEELFDAELEEQADKLLKLYPPEKKSVSEEEGEQNQSMYNRFMDKNAFPDDEARNIAQKLQSAINNELYISDDNDKKGGGDQMKKIYSSTLQWDTPFSKDSKSKTPLDELDNALGFYKRIDVAIVSAKSISNSSTGSVRQMEIRWEISLLWPNVYESRVLISGKSTATVDTQSSIILSQTDILDDGGKEGKDIIQAISSQVQPRFWDLYHIGMTPSAELMPRVQPATKAKGFLSSYDLFEIPPRLVLQPTIVDSGGRETREAQSLPNHAFSSIIKTTGPTAQRYVTTSPVEVSIRRSNGKSVISWNIQLPPEYVSFHEEFPKLVTDEDKKEGNEPTKDYAYQPRRLVATVKYGGYAQDVQVTDLRKKLYEQVVKDGLKPKLGEDGRPQFFFLQNDSKACFTADGGLGMAVYEWRPESANSNEVGIELEL